MLMILMLIGSSMIHTATEEFDNIQSWAAKNNLKVHQSKTKEMIVIGRRKSVLLLSSKKSYQEPNASIH